MLPITRTATARSNTQLAFKPFTTRMFMPSKVIAIHPSLALRPASTILFGHPSTKFKTRNSFKQAPSPSVMSALASHRPTSSLTSMISSANDKSSTRFKKAKVAASATATNSANIKPSARSTRVSTFDDALRVWSHGWSLSVVTVLVGVSLALAIESSKEEEDAEADFLIFCLYFYTAVAVTVVIP